MIEISQIFNLATLLGIVLGGGAVLLFLWRRPRDSAALADQAAIAARLVETQARLAQLQAELDPLRPRLEAALAAQAAAESEARSARETGEAARAAEAAARAALKAEEERRVQAERQAALAQQKLLDFEALRGDMTQAAKAATLDASRELVGQLLAEHKREAEAVKKQGEETLKLTTEALFQQVQQVSGSVAAVTAQVQQLGSRTETIHRALSHPGGAGRLAEIGLENLLKSYGLHPGQDFIVQYHAAGDHERGALRPDAVVFLPQDAVLVIDSKASKALLEHAEAETETAAAEALSRLSQRMAAHLKALSGKDYRSAVLDTYRKLGRGGELKRAMVAMALPNDAAVEKLRQADPTLERRAAEADIVIAGPSALAAIIAFARMDIDAGRQVENHERIMEAVRGLADSMVTALGAAEKSGRALQSAAEHFDRFSRSVNGRLLPRLRKLAQLGVRPAKALPEALPSFEVKVGQGGDVIDAEAEELAVQRLAPAVTEQTRD